MSHNRRDGLWKYLDSDMAMAEDAEVEDVVPSAPVHAQIQKKKRGPQLGHNEHHCREGDTCW